MTTTFDTALQQMLNPVNAEFFRNNHWERESLYVPGPRDKFAELFDVKTLERIMTRSEVFIKAGGGSAAAVQLAPDQAKAAYKAGMALCVQNLEKYDPRLAAFSREAASSFGLMASPRFNCYISSDGKGFPMHCDCHSVWVLQIAGAKRWRYDNRPAMPYLWDALFAFPEWLKAFNIKHPDARIAAPVEDEMADQVLEPGDLLYLPRGTWHEPKAVGYSIALTWACHPRSFLDVLTDRLERDFERVPVPPTLTDGPPPSLPPSLERYFADCIERMRDRLAELTPADFYEAWRSEVFPQQGVPDALIAQLMTDGLLGQTLPQDFWATPNLGS